jgi:hypothetical protein
MKTALKIHPFLPATIPSLVNSALDSIGEELVNINPSMTKDDLRRRVADAAYHWVSTNVVEAEVSQ